MSYSQGPMPPNDPYRRHQEPYDGYRDPYAYADYQDPYAGQQAPQQRRYRDSAVRQDRIALVVQTIADIAAGFLALWILLYLLDANTANVFVDFVRGVATWLAGWAQDIFTMSNQSARVVLNFGLPALVYLALGHGVAAWVRRL